MLVTEVNHQSASGHGRSIGESHTGSVWAWLCAAAGLCASAAALVFFRKAEARAKKVHLPVALQEVTLTEEAAEQLSRMDADPRQPVYAGRTMPTIDESQLLGR